MCKSFFFDRTLYGDLCGIAFDVTREFLGAQFPTPNTPPRQGTNPGSRAANLAGFGRK